MIIDNERIRYSKCGKMQRNWSAFEMRCWTSSHRIELVHFIHILPSQTRSQSVSEMIQPNSTVRCSAFIKKTALILFIRTENLFKYSQQIVLETRKTINWFRLNFFSSVLCQCHYVIFFFFLPPFNIQNWSRIKGTSPRQRQREVDVRTYIHTYYEGYSQLVGKLKWYLHVMHAYTCSFAILFTCIFICCGSQKIEIKNKRENKK